MSPDAQTLSSIRSLGALVDMGLCAAAPPFARQSPPPRAPALTSAVYVIRLCSFLFFCVSSVFGIPRTYAKEIVLMQNMLTLCDEKLGIPCQCM